MELKLQFSSCISVVVVAVIAAVACCRRCCLSSCSYSSSMTIMFSDEWCVWVFGVGRCGVPDGYLYSFIFRRLLRRVKLLAGVYNIHI